MCAMCATSAWLKPRRPSGFNRNLRVSGGELRFLARGRDKQFHLAFSLIVYRHLEQPPWRILYYVADIALGSCSLLSLLYSSIVGQHVVMVVL